LKYTNAKRILPARLLKELQEYVSGELIYIPEKSPVRAGWGETNGAREEYLKRNGEIILLHMNGGSIGEIADRYHLSEDSIRKITNGRKTWKLNKEG
jgi:Mor family transcriptional regulator